jgi:hypothetical protein
MTLWWIGDIVLLVVVVPVVVYLLNAVLSAARSIVPSVRQIADVPPRGPRTSTPCAAADHADRVAQTVAGSPTTAARST